ncbi:MAG: nickel-dependent hydrogenase large subunit [Bdellovibrionales bacterium]|nr:nickel-dependent hydrogenase large subunit [Bdellovibrionales bacterium]
MPTKIIKVDYLARVEGEGALYIKTKGKEVEAVELKIFEPPRFFEAFLRGRSYEEAPDITARICGICPVAYQMSAVHAMEQALGISLDPEIRKLRRLLYCGEWIESHVLHIYMLHAPDFLGVSSAMELAKTHKAEVERGLRMKKIGNRIVSLVGGREIHPINVRVGGFYQIPKQRDLEALLPELEWARQASKQTAQWAAGFTFPDFESEYEFVCLSHPNEYPFNEGQITSSHGLSIPAADFEKHFEEQHVAHSNALHCVRKGGGAYFTGPMARFAMNFEKLSDDVRAEAKKIGVGPDCRNPFRSILIRSLEVMHAYEEAMRIIRSRPNPSEAAPKITPKAGWGAAATEAPRGLLYHHYKLGDSGLIEEAKIVPPTSQNQKRIEQDLRQFVTKNIAADDEKLTWQCEQAIRNYDPCISCATHFLKVKWDREEPT